MDARQEFSSRCRLDQCTGFARRDDSYHSKKYGLESEALRIDSTCDMAYTAGLISKKTTGMAALQHRCAVCPLPQTRATERTGEASWGFQVRHSSLSGRRLRIPNPINSTPMGWAAVKIGELRNLASFGSLFLEGQPSSLRTARGRLKLFSSPVLVSRSEEVKAGQDPAALLDCGRAFIVLVHPHSAVR